MKALSVKQPWATLEALGIKSPEIRTRKTNYRGDVMICSSLKPDYDAPLVGCLYNGNAGNLVGLDDNSDIGAWCDLGCKACFDSLPLGKALAIVTITDCRPMTKEDENDAYTPYREGLWAWVLENVRPIKPFAVKGRLGLWEYEGQCENCKHYFAQGCERARRISAVNDEVVCRWYPAVSLFLTPDQPLISGGQA